MCEVNGLIFTALLKLRLDSQFPATTFFLIKTIEDMRRASGLFVQM